MSNSKLFFGIILIIFLSQITYYFYLGILQPVPALGDSWDYHIPIALSILNGSFLNPQNFLLPQWYYPGSGEIFIAIFSFLKIPLTLSNIFAVIFLVYSLFRLGLIFNLEKFNALIYALSFGSLTVITRWMNSISIDVWLSVFFIWIIVTLEKAKITTRDIFILGLASGMLIGSKYTGIIYLIILFIFYLSSIKKLINFKYLLIFFIPFSITGLFWYIRNFIHTGNPIFPIPLFGLTGQNLFSSYVWKITITYPIEMFNAFYSEYKLLMFLPIIILVLLIKNNFSKYKGKNIRRIYILGLILFLLYFINPSSEEPAIMVSSLRYSYPAFIFLLLGFFVFVQKIKKENYLYFLLTACVISQLTMVFYPKLILIYLPLSLVIYYLVAKKSSP